MELAPRSSTAIDPWSLYTPRANGDKRVDTRHPLVLLVEDDDNLRAAVCEVLRDERYVVASAADGAEALAMMRNGLRPSVVLLDLWLPNVDGATALLEMRADDELKSIPVLIVTAADQIEPRVRESAQAILKKPIEMNRLFDAIERHRIRSSNDPSTH